MHFVAVARASLEADKGAVWIHPLWWRSDVASGRHVRGCRVQSSAQLSGIRPPRFGLDEDRRELPPRLGTGAHPIRVDIIDEITRRRLEGSSLRSAIATLKERSEVPRASMMRTSRGPIRTAPGSQESTGRPRRRRSSNTPRRQEGNASAEPTDVVDSDTGQYAWWCRLGMNQHR